MTHTNELYLTHVFRWWRARFFRLWKFIIWLESLFIHKLMNWCFLFLVTKINFNLLAESVKLKLCVGWKLCLPFVWLNVANKISWMFSWNICVRTVFLGTFALLSFGNAKWYNAHYHQWYHNQRENQRPWINFYSFLHVFAHSVRIWTL